MNDCIIIWECPESLLVDNGRHVYSELYSAVRRMMAILKLTIRAYRVMGKGGIERLNRTMAQMLLMIVNDRQDNWDKQLQIAPCSICVQ